MIKKYWPIVLAGLLLVGVFTIRPVQATVQLAPEFAGDLDPTFGSGGKVITTFLEGDAGLADVQLQANQYIVAGGTVSSADATDFALARYQPNGLLDTSFGSGGKVVTHFDGYAAGMVALGLLGDGRIIGFGSGISNGSLHLLLARYLADGTLDASFGSGGKLVLDQPDSLTSIVGATDIAIQADGKLVLAITAITDTGKRTAAALRYNADGIIDTQFGADGVVKVYYRAESAEDRADVLSLQPDGRIIVAGEVDIMNAHGLSGYGITRLLADGSRDDSFAFHGGDDIGWGQITAATLQADGKIVLTGQEVYCGTMTCNQPFTDVSRLNADGSFDKGFYTHYYPPGIFVQPHPATISGLLVMPDGSIIAVGALPGAFVLASFMADGSLNTTFGNNGVVSTQFADGSEGKALVLQANLRLVAGGTSTSGDVSSFALAGYQIAPAQPTQTPTATVTATVNPLPTSGPGCLFSDVCPRDFFFAAVDYLQAHNVLSGYGDNTFRPYADTTRGQMSKIVVLAEQLPITVPSSGQTFRDVPRSDTFFRFIETAVARGIVNGYSCGTNCREFHTYSQVTRGQLSKIVALAANWQLLNPATPRFSDVSRTNAFYRYIETAAAHNIISGYADGTFRWYANAPRGQISKLVYLAVTEASATPTATVTPTGSPVATTIATATLTPAASATAAAKAAVTR